MRSLPLLWLLLAACPKKEKAADAPPAAAAPRLTAGKCLADGLGDLKLSVKVDLNCVSASDECRASCLTGSVSTCMTLAVVHQQDGNDAEAHAMFARGCELGSANGCTNYAATLWRGAKPTDPAQACAERLFMKSCEATDPFACGMVGRLMIEDASPPKLDQGKRVLESACQRLKGFPCRVLAWHLEDGKLGSANPDKIQELLKRACEGGDEHGCGNPPNAAGTFD